MDNSTAAVSAARSESDPASTSGPVYAAPMITRLGTLTELTLGGDTDMSDAMGGNGDASF